MSRKQKFWIQNINVKKGALSRQLKIPESENIPISLLEIIVSSPIGTIIVNHSRGTRIKVTRLLKQRANLALRFKRMRK